MVSNADAIGYFHLKQSKFGEAADYLMRASRTPGGIGLGSFGLFAYETQLVRDLVRAGDKTASINFLKNVQLFWHNDDAMKATNYWIKSILNGDSPDFRWPPAEPKPIDIDANI